MLAARAAGIRPVMITGDHPSTAAAVAARTGVTRAGDAPTAPDALLRPVYARTDPAEKLGIITAWQRAGHVVAMTGDGVNDAPALRAADVGVAMGVRGTEVAKQAADVVLTDDSLSTIVAAVAEGRRVFDNVRRFVRYGVAGGLAELVMLLGPFLGLALPERDGPRMRLHARAGLARSGKGPKSHQRCPLSGRSGSVDACLVRPIRPIVGGGSRPNDRDKGCT